MKTHNKVTYAIMGLTAGAALLFAAGCSKQEPPAGDATKTTTPAASEAPKPTDAPKPAASQEATPAAAAAQPAMTTAPATAPAAPAAGEAQKAADAATAATSQTGTTVAAADSQVQTVIEKAKGLVTDQKYKDALTAVQQLSSLRLTPDQRTLVDGLKTQIQAALAKDAASDAASSLGNVLGGKK